MLSANFDQFESGAFKIFQLLNLNLHQDQWPTCKLVYLHGPHQRASKVDGARNPVRNGTLLPVTIPCICIIGMVNLSTLRTRSPTAGATHCASSAGKSYIRSPSGAQRRRQRLPPRAGLRRQRLCGEPLKLTCSSMQVMSWQQALIVWAGCRHTPLSWPLAWLGAHSGSSRPATRPFSSGACGSPSQKPVTQWISGQLGGTPHNAPPCSMACAVAASALDRSWAHAWTRCVKRACSGAANWPLSWPPSMRPNASAVTLSPCFCSWRSCVGLSKGSIAAHLAHRAFLEAQAPGSAAAVSSMPACMLHLVVTLDGSPGGKVVQWRSEEEDAWATGWLGGRCTPPPAQHWRTNGSAAARRMNAAVACAAPCSMLSCSTPLLSMTSPGCAAP